MSVSVIDATSTGSTGTVMVSGNMPACSYYLSSNQTISASTHTAIAFNTKIFDTANAFNNTGSAVTLNGLSVPAYSFCPPVAGYYQVTVSAQMLGSVSAETSIYKNTNFYLYGPFPMTGNGPNTQVTALIYLNGVGDYVTGYGLSTGTSINGTSTATTFSAIMMRAA